MGIIKLNRHKHLPVVFDPAGGCLPYVIATICNDQSIIEKYPAQDPDGKPLSHSFYHASMMIAEGKNQFLFFDVFLARPRTVNRDGKIKCPKPTVQFIDFSHSAKIYSLTKTWKNKIMSKFVFLLDVYSQGKSHAVGMILDVHTGQAIIIDRQKDYIQKLKIGDVFGQYRVLRVAILHVTHNALAVFSDESIAHILSSEHGQSSDG